jgi:glutamate transport system permease protein
MAQTSVLYDVPGPRARRRNAMLSVVFGLVLIAAAASILMAFQAKGQLAGELWQPFLEAQTWTQFILPALAETLKAAFVGMALALAFGIVFAVGRLSTRRWISVPAGIVVEFFRAVPLLLLIFFLFYGLPFIVRSPVPGFWALVLGLTLYNGSVLAEAFRAGIRAVPKGQSEAGYAIGLRKSGVMRYILVPQAARSMLPVILSQLVVLLKDTALGYIIAYPELLQRGVNDLAANKGNVIAAAIVVAAIFILVNSSLTAAANWVSRRQQRTSRSRTRQPAVSQGSAVPGAV